MQEIEACTELGACNVITFSREAVSRLTTSCTPQGHVELKGITAGVFVETGLTTWRVGRAEREVHACNLRWLGNPHATA
jgi:hypothetical protein